MTGSLDPAQFRSGVLAPALAFMTPYGPAGNRLADPIAANLLIGTFCQETHLGGLGLAQIGGPGLGIGSMQPLTLANVMRTLPSGMTSRIINQAQLPDEQIISDLRFACITARWYYWLSPMPLPTSGEPADLWPMYKQVYNTAAGAATEAEFIANCSAYGGF